MPEGPKDLREELENVQKELKKLSSKNESLESENRKLKASNAFRDAQLAPNLADLYVAANPEADISVEAAIEFAEAYGIQGGAKPVQAAEGEGTPESTEEPPAPQRDDSGLQNIARAGSSAGGTGQPPAQKLLTRDEFLDLQQSNPAKAREALAEGRVQLRADNPMGVGASHTPGSNPFRAQHESTQE